VVSGTGPEAGGVQREIDMNDTTLETVRTSDAVARTAEIVVGIDGSPAAAGALRWAAEQSRMTGLPLRVLHAYQITAVEAAAVSAGAGAVWEAVGADALARATSWVKHTLGEEATSVRWSLDVVEGAPGPVLVAESRHARLLVLGTQAHTGIQRAVHASVSHYCLTHADPPVVAFPTQRAVPAPARHLGAAVIAAPLL
jgi:nucleotide-binding universal stress UspA family protein